MRKQSLGETFIYEVDELTFLPETNDKSKADFLLFSMAVQLEVWGARPLLHKITQDPGLFLLVALRGYSFFHVTKADFLTPHSPHTCCQQVKQQEEMEYKQWPFKNVTQNCTYIHSHPLAQNLVTPTCTRGREVQTVEVALHLPKLGAYIAKRKRGRLAI